MSDYTAESQLPTERGTKSTGPTLSDVAVEVSLQEASHGSSGYHSQSTSLVSFVVGDDSSIVKDSGPKRGSIGLDIVVDLICGEPKDFHVPIVKTIFEEYGRLMRFSIEPDGNDSRRVNISANARSVSEALRIIKNLNGKVFSENGFRGKLRITLRKDRVGLKSLTNNEYYFDFSIDRHEKNKMKMVYCPDWYGRDSYYMDYEEIGKHNGPYVKPPEPQYPPVPEVAQFWKNNCGPDFPAMVAKFIDKKRTKIPKLEMHSFYVRLFNAIFDQGMGCAPDDSLVDDDAVVMEKRRFSGYVIGVTQHRACGAVMIVEYIRANFSGSLLELDSEGSDGADHSSSDEETGKRAKTSLYSAVGGEFVEDIVALLKLYARGGKLDFYAGCSWIYGMSVYRDKVFYTRMNCATCKFQILNQWGVFESAQAPATRRLLWHSVLSELGYRQFQIVVNEMDESIASV